MYMFTLRNKESRIFVLFLDNLDLITSLVKKEVHHGGKGKFSEGENNI